MFDEGEKLRKEFGADKVFDFSLGNPDLEPPPEFALALGRLASDTRLGTHGYMPNAGYPAVREAVAAHASREQGVAIPASNIVMTVGAAGAINVAFRTLLDPGDEVLVIRPWFAEYWFYVQNYGGVFVEAPSGPGFHLDLAAIERALTPRTAIVMINSPNNPTGVIYTRDELVALAALLRAHGERTGRRPCLIADEPYRQIVFGGAEVPSVLGIYPETLVVTSWSKSLSLPGERIGYIAVSPTAVDAHEIVDGLVMSTRILGFVNAPALLQRSVAEILESRADVSSYERRCRLLSKGLREAGYEFPEPQGAFYIFARVPPRGDGEGRDDIEFAMHLKRFNILAVPGVGFGSPGWFRLSFCVPETTIRGAIPGFVRALEEWKRA
jgi:aspartate aminotransferase